MTTVSTSEEMDKKEEVSQALQIVETIKNIYSDMEDVNLGELIKIATRSYISNPEFVKAVENLPDKSQSQLVQAEVVAATGDIIQDEQ